MQLIALLLALMPIWRLDPDGVLRGSVGMVGGRYVVEQRENNQRPWRNEAAAECWRGKAAMQVNR